MKKPFPSVLALSLFGASSLFAQTTGTWNLDTNTGNTWSTVANWTGLTGELVPNAPDAAVTFGPLITAGRTVSLDINVTVGSLTFNEDGVTANSYAVAFNNVARTMTFEAGTGDATVAARGVGGYQIGTLGSGQVVLNNHLAISVGNSGAATSEGGGFNINSQIIDGNVGAKGLILSTLSSTDGSNPAVTSGFRGTYLRSTIGNSFSGGVTVNSGFLGIFGNIGNAGSGAITLNASESTSGIGTGLTLKTGGGSLTNNIVFGNSAATGGGSPRLAIFLRDDAASDYSFDTGTITGALGNQQIRVSSQGNVASSITLSGDGSSLTSGANGLVHVRSGVLILDNASALTTGNTLGGATSGGFSVGNFSNDTSGSAQLLTNGHNVGARITTQQTTAAGQTSADNVVVGGSHTTGTATFSGNVLLGRIVGGARQFQFTSATGGTTVFSGVISDTTASGSNLTALPVYKVDDGLVSFTNANTYTGGTTVSAGTLLVNNPSGSGLGTGSVSVLAPATLGGTGTINGALTSAGTVAPGSGGIGTLTVEQPVTLSGTLAIDLGASTSDQLAVLFSDLNLTGATLAITGGASAAAASYLIVDYNDGVTFTGNANPNTANTFASVTGLPAGYAIVHDTVARQIRIEGAPVGGSSYASYAAAFSNPALSNTAADADPDNDGLKNAVEYVLGTDPRFSNPTGLTSSTVGTNLVITFNRKDSSETADTALVVQTSTNLSGWADSYTVAATTAASTTPGVNVNEAGPADTDIITVTIPNGVDANKFARLKVTVTP